MIIEFTKPAWEKINMYIQATEEEISGLATAKLNEHKSKIIVNDVRIWKQKCSSATTEVTANEETIKLVEEFKKDGHNMQDICVWWHSHANMSAFFSGTDDETIDNWVNQRFLVAVVGNRAGEFKGKISIKEPIPCILDDITVTREPDKYDLKLQKKIEKEVKEKIEKETFDSYYEKAKNKYQTSLFWKNDKKEKKIKLNNYKEYEKYRKNLSNAQKRQLLIDSATYCDCDRCKDFILGKTTKFPFKDHMWDSVTATWSAMGEAFMPSDFMDDLYLESSDGRTRWEAEDIKKYRKEAEYERNIIS